MNTASPKARRYREHLQRVRHTIELTVTQLTTIKELMPSDDELDAASERRDLDESDLPRRAEVVEIALQDMTKLTRLFVDRARASAGLDPQCCEWETSETTGSC